MKTTTLPKSAVRARALRMVSYLKKAYREPKSELVYRTHFQFVAAVILSAQCTDKAVNRVTKTLWKHYKSSDDFADASLPRLTKELSSLPFFRNKARAIIGAAKDIRRAHGGNIPKSEQELVALPGIGYKTAHVVLGELFNEWSGIPTDTHVRRFALRLKLTRHTNLTKISKDLEALIPKRDWKYVNNGLVLYGRYVCPARRHECRAHPLTKLYPKAATIWPKAK